MNHRLTQFLLRLLRPVLKPVARVYLYLEPYIARAVLKQARTNPPVMGFAILVIRGDDARTRARVAEVLEYIARSPRHLALLRRTLKCISVGAPTVEHGKYVATLHACHLAVPQLDTQSVPALAATVIQAATQARLHRVGLETDAGPVPLRRRAAALCVRASTDFLDSVQHRARGFRATPSPSGLTSA